MNHPSRLFITTAAVLFTSQAYADGPCCRQIPRWYGSISGNAVFLTNSEVEYHPRAQPNDSYSFNVGYGFSGAVGYRFYPNVRGEVEVAYRNNELSQVNGVSVASTSGGYLASTSLAPMINGYYDFHNSSAITPYLGIGIGEERVTRQEVWTPAYQFMAGINYEIPHTPMELIFGYRYVGSEDATIPYDNPPITKASVSNASQNLELGVRFFFK